MIEASWRLCFLPGELPAPAGSAPFAVLPGWEEWLRADGTPAGTPFLLSPSFEYDVALNAFFRSAGMLASAGTTQAGYARDLAAFLSFLHGADRNTAETGNSLR